jgi:hypothetical protein
MGKSMPKLMCKIFKQISSVACQEKYVGWAHKILNAFWKVMCSQISFAISCMTTKAVLSDLRYSSTDGYIYFGGPSLPAFTSGARNPPEVAPVIRLVNVKIVISTLLWPIIHQNFQV